MSLEYKPSLGFVETAGLVIAIQVADAMAKAAALVRGRDYVNPEDVELVFPDVVPHRLLLSPRAEGDKSFDPAAELLAKVPAPRIA